MVSATHEKAQMKSADLFFYVILQNRNGADSITLLSLIDSLKKLLNYMQIPCGPAHE